MYYEVVILKHASKQRFSWLLKLLIMVTREHLDFFQIPRDTIEKVSSSLSLSHLQFFYLVLGQLGCWEQPIGSRSKP